MNVRGALHDASEGGVAGHHSDTPPFELIVAPSTSSEFNTARLRLIPVACWRVDQIRFALDSSFVTPDITEELKMLQSLREIHKRGDIGGKVLYPPLSVFGHADPVGSDDYNKALSGRRATVIYALLIANTEPEKAFGLWQHVARAENWGKDQSGMMQDKTGLPASTPESQLLKAYLKQLSPAELAVGPHDFLAQGADGGGKGAYQGSDRQQQRALTERGRAVYRRQWWRGAPAGCRTLDLDNLWRRSGRGRAEQTPSAGLRPLPPMASW